MSAIDRIAIALCRGVYAGGRCSCEARGTGPCESMKGVAAFALAAINIKPDQADLLANGEATVRLKPQKKVKT